MKNLIPAILLMAILSIPVFAATAEVDPIPMRRYLDYARKTADWTWDHYTEIVDKWQKAFDPESIFGYRPPGNLLETAVIYAHLFEKEGNRVYADRAMKVLLEYRDFRRIYPEAVAKKRFDYSAGVPVLPDFFTAMRFIRAYGTLRRLGVLAAAECIRLEQDITGSMEYLLQTQEWGAMNRAMLRAECLAWAIRVLPQNPRRAVWEMQRRALGDDNWGAWQIEDASVYNCVWLYSLLGYAEALGKSDDLFRMPVMVYYAHYFLQLMSPAGMVPDFGDANWQANWAHFLVFFEAAANALHDGRMKWAAGVIARRFVDFSRPENSGLGYMLIEASRWGSDAVKPRPPQNLSGEVLEDVQGKKVVFRNDWNADATYLLLNYRDEGDGGLGFRDYLRDTIPVEEEKMTHGHADENSLVLLMSGGSVLLHDAGYRDYLPSGSYGAYRQDYFHTRLCVRPEKIWMGQKKGESRYSMREAVAGQPVLEFLRNAGSYRRVRTQKMDFLSLDDFDYSRTRLVDDGWGYAWDRAVVHLKEPGIFVVFDIFKALREEYFTAANLWHTRKIVARGEHWYDTVYDRIGDQVLPEATHLLILFPYSQFRLEGMEKQMRHYQEELTIHQTAAQHFELGECTGFVTVLVPHRAGDPPEGMTSRFRALSSYPERAASGLEIRCGAKTFVIGLKQDLRRGMILDNRRPRYTYEAGKFRVADFETDGDLLVACLAGDSPNRRMAYTVVNMTRLDFRGKTLAAAKPWNSGLFFDGSPDAPGIGKLRYWRDAAACEESKDKGEKK